MTDPDFQPYRRSVEELLTGSEYYVIPRFQRPYSWDSGNLEEFWRDVIEENGAGYFIGPMVAWRGGSPTVLALVDGQQRLTTITLLLAAIRDALLERRRAKLAEGVHRYIERPDRDNEPRFVLQPEVTAPFLNSSNLMYEPDRSFAARTDEEKTLQWAHRALRDRLLAAVQDQPQPDEELRRIRDMVLALRVIWVELGNEDDAYVVFETLNSRGKDLEAVDLLKNLLLNKLRQGRNRTADPHRERFNAMRVHLEESAARLDVNRFILHWWLSQEAYVAQRKLFSAIKRQVTTRGEAEQRLADLEHDGPLYRMIFDPDSHDWPMEKRQVRDSLAALSIFGVVQPAPLLLALLRAHHAPDAPLRVPQLTKALQTIERFHFQFTAIAQLSSSGGVSEMYARYARAITHAPDPQQCADEIRKLQQALVDRQPDRDIFISSFTERLVLTDEITRDKKLVRYVLERLLAHTNPRTSTEALTVEHLLPQARIGSDAETTAGVVGSIGNLLLVDDRLNGRLANKGVARKQQLLVDQGSHYDVQQILDATEWGPAQISERAQRLAQLAYDEVWRLPVR